MSGAHHPRPEDARLVAGRGRYVADLEVAGALSAVFVRSAHAHARLAGISTRRASAVPGVRAVYTGADLVARGLGAIPYRQFPPNPRAVPLQAPPRRALTADVARFVGDPLALVVAETAAAAQDAAELVDVEYVPLPPIVGEPVEPSSAPRAVAGVWEDGDRDAVAAALRAADRVVSVALVNNRLVPVSMETRGALCEFDQRTGRYTLHVPCQMPHLLRAHLARDVLGIPEERLRVLVPDIGGGFGAKVFCYPEYAAVAIAASDLGRPVRWIDARGDAFLGDVHGRDQVNRAQLALDGRGRFLALQVETRANVGAYLSFQGGFIPTISSFRVLAGVYDIPLVHARCECLLTNTTPTDAYRGAGRPEAVYLIERLADLAAAETGLDRVEIRRRNLVPASAMPYRTALGDTIDSGDFARVLDRALALHDWDGFADRRREAAVRGRLAGRGLAMFIEHTGRNEFTETVELAVHGSGRVVALSGTQEMGQGLKASYARLLAERLELPPERIEVIQGDTDRVRSGGGSGGSRSLFVGGSAMVVAARALLERATGLAATALEASPSDLAYARGRFAVAGTDRSVGLAELAAGAPGGALAVRETATAGGLTWPNGCHVCEVEIDPETGTVAVTRYTGVDDVGRVVSSTLVDGQLHGGIAQGIGQALLERTAYGAAGQLLAGSFMDYAVPRADDLPAFVLEHDESSPATTNLLGAKGAGECGATGAPPAVVSAVVDALDGCGVRHLDMPIRAEDVWKVLREVAAAVKRPDTGATAPDRRRAQPTTPATPPARAR